MRNFMANYYRPSLFLLGVSAGITAGLALRHPSLGVFITAGVNFVILMSMRKTAMIEGASESAFIRATAR